MFDFDPRDDRDDERSGVERHHGSRDAEGRDFDDQSPPKRGREARRLGRGPADEAPASRGVGAAHDRDVHPRDLERDRDRERDRDPRDALLRRLNLPRRPDRTIVRYRDREYTLRGSESRTLATVGAFRVVSSRDLLDHRDRPADPRSGDLRHLHEQGLIETVRVSGYREPAVVLTKDGRNVLESHRGRDNERPQTFYAGVKRERELEHDVQVCRAYLREAERLEERVVLDYELKREYQTWLHERDRDRDDYDGHPDRTDDEIRDWADEYDLPYFDGAVHFLDVRIEYQNADGRWDHDDDEVITPHYRGAHGASVARSGFISFRGSSARGGASPFDPERRRR